MMSFTFGINKTFDEKIILISGFNLRSFITFFHIIQKCEGMKLIQNYHSEISLSLSLPLSQLWAEVVGNLKKRKERVDSKTFLNQLHAFTFLYYMEERNERSQVKIAK